MVRNATDLGWMCAFVFAGYAIGSVGGLLSVLLLGGFWKFEYGYPGGVMLAMAQAAIGVATISLLGSWRQRRRAAQWAGFAMCAIAGILFAAETLLFTQGTAGRGILTLVAYGGYLAVWVVATWTRQLEA